MFKSNFHFIQLYYLAPKCLPVKKASLAREFTSLATLLMCVANYETGLSE